MRRWICLLGMMLLHTGMLVLAGDVRVGIYGPELRDRQSGIFEALESASGIAKPRYVSEITPAGLTGLDVLVVPQILHPGRLKASESALRKWIGDGHGVMTIHDAVGYRKHPALFPEFAKGVGNPFNHDTGYGKYCITTVEHTALKGLGVSPVVVEHGYFDQVQLEVGPKGVILAREAIVLDKNTFETGVPVVAAGVQGKGRYVANGLAIGYDASSRKGAPRGDELKLFLGLVRWLAGEGDASQLTDIGPGVKVARIATGGIAAQKEDISRRIREIAAQSMAPWSGKWRKSDMSTAPAVVKSNYKAPLNLDPELVKSSGYTEVAADWTRMELRDQWKCRDIEESKANPEHDEGMKQGYERVDYDDSEWETQPVPKESKHICERITGVRWYRRVVLVPEFKKAQRAVLTFTRCGIETKIWVNGQYVGEHIGSSSPFEFDVTDVVKGGQTNIVAARVFDMTGGEGSFKMPDGSVINKSPYLANMGHLWGEVHLTVKPELYSHRTFVTPHLSTSEIEVDMWLSNHGGRREVSLAVEVLPAPPPLAKGVGQPSRIALKSVMLAPGVNRQTFRVPMKDPVLWSTENPYLYLLQIKNGAAVLARERFGFRDFRIAGPCFLLNGKKVNLIAHTMGQSVFDMSRRIEIDNEAMFMTKYLLAMKSWNANTAYTMGMPHPRQFYDVCDELGVLVYADWNAAHWRFNNPPMAAGWNKGEGEIEVWMAERYNHPSAVMSALGAELFERYTPAPYGTYDELLNPAYDLLKAMDKHDRPICPSSGRDTWMRDGAKTDVHDFHAYPGNIAGSWTDESGMILKRWQHALAHQPVKPLIQYEMDGGRFFNQDLKVFVALLKDEKENGRMDRQKVIELFQQKAYRMGLGWLSSLYGFRRYAADLGSNGGWRQGAGWQIFVRKNVGQASRIAGPLLSGYCANTETFSVVDITETGDVPNVPRGWIHTRLGKGWDITDDLAKKRFVEAEGYRTWQRVNNPTLICMDRYDRNLFAGSTFAADIYAINDVDAPSVPWTARCVVRDAKGNVLDDRIADVGAVPGFKRKILQYTYATPEELGTGFYDIELFLYEGDKVVSDNYEQFFVLGKADQVERLVLDPGLKIALYDTRAKKHSAGISTKSVLDQLQVSCTALANFDTIAEYDVLIIGADSADDTVRKSSRKLKGWLKSGGRLLQFEQHVGGSVPYYRKVKLLSVKPHILAEIIESHHPAFKGLDYRHMERWSDLPGSRTPGEIYRQLLGPINVDVLASATVSVPRQNTRNNQMVLTESVVGEGRLVVSQFEATQRYGTDSVATRLIWNLLEYIMGHKLWDVDQDGPDTVDKAP